MSTPSAEPGSGSRRGPVDHPETQGPDRAPTRQTSRWVLVASILARMPQGLAPLSVVLLAQERTGSIAAAGLAGGAWAMGSAVSQPLWGGLAGRGRAHRIEAATASMQALVLVALAVGTHDAEQAVIALAGLGGLFSAPTSPISRTLWPQLALDEHHLDALYTHDATWQELIFIAGPAMVGFLVAASGPSASLLTAAALGVVGAVVFSFIIKPLWQPHPEPASRVRLGRSLRLMAGPYTVLCLMALGLGMAEVGVPAAAIIEDNRAASGWLLALWSVGSLVGGLCAARITWRRNSAQRWPGLLLGVAAGTATTVIGWQFGLPWLGVSLFLAGLALAPSLAAGYGVIGERAAPGRRTDAFAWTTTFLLIGIGSGVAIGGVLADVSPTWTFAAGAAVSVVAAGAAQVWVTQRAR
ncbi:MAG: MFS transporter [Actinomycetes bacterium]